MIRLGSLIISPTTTRPPVHSIFTTNGFSHCEISRDQSTARWLLAWLSPLRAEQKRRKPATGRELYGDLIPARSLLCVAATVSNGIQANEYHNITFTK